MNAKRMTPSGNEPSADDAADDCAQRLSILLDGELDREQCRELFERLRRDSDACRRWAMLNCVGDALRSPEVAAWHSDDFVARVGAALEKEPTVLAPTAKRPHGNLRRWLLPGAGAAAAAAVVMVVGLPSGPLTPARDVADAPGAAQRSTVVAVQEPLQIDRSPLLERYLAAHRELAEPALMPNSTPYVRTSGALHLQEGR